MYLSVVIPMYNEQNAVENAVRELDRSLAKSFGVGNYEMIFVGDGCKDDSVAIAEDLKKEFVALRVISYELNRGKGHAVRTGMLEANGDFVLFTDCDLAYGADIIKDFYEDFIGSGCDVVIGSRAIKGGGYDGYTFLRRVMSKAYLKVVSIFAGFDLSDSQCGIKGFSGGYAKKIFGLCEAERFEFDLEALMIAEKLGCRIKEHPVRVINHGDSKVRPLKDALKMLGQIRKIKKRVKKIDKNKV